MNPIDTQNAVTTEVMTTNTITLAPAAVVTMVTGLTTVSVTAIEIIMREKDIREERDLLFIQVAGTIIGIGETTKPLLS